MEIHIGIQTKVRNEIITLLNNVLADEHVLYVKTRNYHWNVTAKNFSELHKFFEAQYDQLAEIIDEVAERARQLDGKADGSMAEFLKRASLKEDTGKTPEASTMLTNLLKDHEAIIRHLREGLETCEKKGDMGTCDFLTGLMEQHEKIAWMLRASV